MKYATSYFLIASPLARSDLHSAVQPPVNAAGNHARMTARPLYWASVWVFPSDPGRENAGAASPSFSSTGLCTVAAAEARRPSENAPASTSFVIRQLLILQTIPRHNPRGMNFA